MVAGERSEPIGGGTFFANLEPMYVQFAEVKLKNKIDAIDSMYIVDSNGVELGSISLDKIYDSTEKTWRGTLTKYAYKIPKGEQRTIGVEVRMKGRNQGGTSDQLVQVDSFRLTTEGEWSTSSTTAIAPTPFPQHQTSYGRITAVRNAMEAQGVLPLGPSSLLASFAIDGVSNESVTLSIDDLEFQVAASSDISVTNWKLGTPESNDRVPCSVSGYIVSCSSLPLSIGSLSNGTRTFRLYGDVSLAPSAVNKSMQISLNQAGDLSTIGAVQWTDQSGHFNWVNLPQPLARGTEWR